MENILQSPTQMEALVPWAASHIIQLRKAMNKMRNQKKFTDVTILCGNKSFQAHRIVLTTSSSFFEDLLKTEDDTPTVIEMEDVEDDVMLTVLDLIYLGHIDLPFVSAPTILKILTTVHLLNIKDGAKYLCCQWLKKGQLSKFQLFWDWADEFQESQVLDSVIEQVVLHFNQLPKGVDYLRLNPNRMKTLLAHPKINVGKCQDILVHVILSWINHEPKMRKSYLDKFISYVDVHSLSDECRQKLLREKPLLQFFCEMKKSVATNEPARVFAKGQLVPILSEERKLKQAMRKELRKVDVTPRTEINTDRSPNKRMFSSRINFCGPSSSTTTHLKLPSITASCCTTGCMSFQEALLDDVCDVLLIVGRGELNRFMAHIYLPSKSTWSVGETIPTTAVLKRACVYNRGALYFIGGEDDSDDIKLANMDVFYIGTGEFTAGPPLRIPRCSAGVATWRQMILVAGGLNRFNKAMSHVEAFDTELNAWRLIQPMRHQKFRPGVTVFNGILYVVGGCTTKCECLDLEKDVYWKELPSLPELYRETPMVATHHNDQLIAFREFRPDRICVLNTQHEKAEWRTLRTGGYPPESIDDSLTYRGELYALDKGGKLHVLDLEVFIWDQSVACPKTLTQVYHIMTVNLGEINNLAGSYIS